MTGGSARPLRPAALPSLAALAAVALLTALLGGCSDDGSGPDAGELIGLWGAVQYEYTSAADPDRTYDLILDGGGTYSIELVTGGTYHWTLNSAGATTTGAGRFTVSGGRLTLDPDGGGEPTVFSASFNDVFLTLRRDDAEWDFEGDGTAEPAELLLVLDRF